MAESIGQTGSSSGKSQGYQTPNGEVDLRTARNTVIQLLILLNSTQDFDAVSSRFEIEAESIDGTKYINLTQFPTVTGAGETWREALEDMRDSAEMNLECFDWNGKQV